MAKTALYVVDEKTGQAYIEMTDGKLLVNKSDFTILDNGVMVGNSDATRKYIVDQNGIVHSKSEYLEQNNFESEEQLIQNSRQEEMNKTNDSSSDSTSASEQNNPKIEDQLDQDRIKEQMTKTDGSSSDSATTSEEALTMVPEEPVVKYTIKSGDTLSEIANEHNKKGGQFMSVEALALLNGISNPNLIVAGEELTLTVNSDVVQASIDNINKVITIAENLQGYREKLSNFGLTDDDQGLDQKASELKMKISENLEVIITNANLYKNWLNDLLTSLNDTELWATNVIDKETMFGIKNIE